jgi:[ribosomal protein S5]-alanine N-acetyltransferase
MQITLRHWTEADITSLLKYANDWDIAKYLTDKFPHPYTQEAAEGFIAMTNSHTPHRIYAIDHSGEAIGAIGIHPLSDIYRTSAELGYWIGQQHWGNGYCGQALAQIIPIAFENFDITRLFARTFASNIGSQKVLLHNGFVQEACFTNTILKSNEFSDELVFALRK